MLPLIPAFGACIGDSGPYDGGGQYPTSECTRAGEQLVAETAGEQLWDDALGADQTARTRDFSLLDNHAYRVRLTHFCGDTVLLVVGDMRDPQLDWLDELPDWLESRPDDAPDLTIMTTWWADTDGDVPTAGDLRRFRASIQEDRGDLAWVYDFASSEVSSGVKSRQILTLQDPYRFEDAAAAASVMYVASDVPADPDPDRRYRREHEVRDRWRHRQEPYFVVLQPILRIVAMGSDPEADGIIEALQDSP